MVYYHLHLKMTAIYHQYILHQNLQRSNCQRINSISPCKKEIKLKAVAAATAAAVVFIVSGSHHFRMIWYGHLCFIYLTIMSNHLILIYLL